MGSSMFPSPQVGSEHRRRNPLPAYQPNVSIPSSRVGTQAMSSRARYVPLVSIPSSRVGTSSFGCDHLAASEFPSPQVGSELLAPRWHGRCVRCFHPLKSGRNGSPATKNSLCQVRFHPLKSGRNMSWRSEEQDPVSKFPSPQVGSEQHCDSRSHSAPPSFHPLKSGRNPNKAMSSVHDTMCFHPLKSGRNKRVVHPRKKVCQVSIPSSRVGTR